MNDIKRYEFEEVVKELESYRGRHTELVSVLIPKGFSINNIIKQIELESGTATNIRSKNTRKAVLDALERILRQLKTMGNSLPDNGLAIYAGNVSEVEGQEDIRLWCIEPIKELNTKRYRCDQIFEIEPLKEMLSVDEIYGLLIIERNEATIGSLEGKSIKMIKKLTSGIPSKQRSGGQAALRFQRINDDLTTQFYRRVAEDMKDIFFNNKKLKGILIGGTFPTKEDFIRYGQLVTKLKDKIIAVKSVSTTEFSGLRDLVEESKDVIAEQEVIKQKQILDEFFMMLAKKPELVSYGFKEVKEKLESGYVSKLIVSKELAKEELKLLERLAKDTSAEVFIVTKDTQEGLEFFNISGAGGILRF